MLLDEGPRTAFQLLMLFSVDVFSGSSFSYQTLDPEPQTRALTSEDGGRRTVDVFSRSSNLSPQVLQGILPVTIH